MTILSALAALYERMEEAGEAPAPGYSTEKIGAELVIDAEGQLIAWHSLMTQDGKRMVPENLSVPAAIKRSSGIAPNFLWDKTSYVLGVTALKDEKKKPLADAEGRLQPCQERRTADEHAHFVALHRERLGGAEDPGLLALLIFLDHWNWEDFSGRGLPSEMLDQNVVFSFEARGQYLHRRAAARALIACAPEAKGPLCLVTGAQAAPARLHPSIKGVMGSQSSGASLVSFNASAFESFGHKQGDNAPVSEHAAFAYGTALNALLARSGKAGRRTLRIGETTAVFWAETDRRETDEAAEMAFADFFDPPDTEAMSEDEKTAHRKLQITMEALARGSAPDDPRFAPSTRVYVLGLAPNAARLSVRFWLPGTLGDFARHVERFREDLRIEPAPWRRPPAVWALLYETALQHKAENIPPRLGGDLMRAVLMGTPYPRTLLSAVIGRIRADGVINGARAAICKAVLTRNLKEEFPVSLDPDNPSPAYRLGRLFAVLESIQQAALPGLNATIRDRYFAAASATPARVFPLLTKTATHHLANLRKSDKGGLAYWFDEQIGEIWSGLDPNLPGSLTLEDQGRFVAGYYHQKFYKKPKDAESDLSVVEGETT
ncbi:type I-C CRISPR-associated protein Cas8c/Csd1 [Celeribacter ethanolicus]|uniref:Type I-C CRISPR-associated protein Cas8c/Csd1 n=1 Tax=Celeribacter ethanolicus TaxID=1758178 RepID=A0A291GCY0_9RHOB|nr:type I-C CRISPR-associated protein Cas8c/Csd1 [Celeribacter ethanolicus]ATG47904.1 type I-C CRISPR-associated protein Cas8c/Csd1 [Celeribacter ethanolicus]TNE65511.1 MAG: type I-C CRISPR-associated protein Cas8c/Csd1 [Paracoccaceae bacterium]